MVATTFYTFLFLNHEGLISVGNYVLPAHNSFERIKIFMLIICVNVIAFPRETLVSFIDLISYGAFDCTLFVLFMANMFCIIPHRKFV